MYLFISKYFVLGVHSYICIGYGAHHIVERDAYNFSRYQPINYIYEMGACIYIL